MRGSAPRSAHSSSYIYIAIGKVICPIATIYIYTHTYTHLVVEALAGRGDDAVELPKLLKKITSAAGAHYVRAAHLHALWCEYC